MNTAKAQPVTIAKRTSPNVRTMPTPVRDVLSVRHPRGSFGHSGARLHTAGYLDRRRRAQLVPQYNLPCHVAGVTEGYEVVEPVGRFVVAIERAERDEMVHVVCPVRFAQSTILARVGISPSRLASLAHPVWSIGVAASASPIRVIRATGRGDLKTGSGGRQFRTGFLTDCLSRVNLRPSWRKTFNGTVSPRSVLSSAGKCVEYLFARLARLRDTAFPSDISALAGTPASFTGRITKIRAVEIKQCPAQPTGARFPVAATCAPAKVLLGCATIPCHLAGRSGENGPAPGARQFVKRGHVVPSIIARPHLQFKLEAA
jgi:hypothetical protein